MRYLATSDFLDKVKTLANQPEVRHELQQLLEIVQASEKSALMGILLNDGVYVVAHGRLRAFLSFGTDASGEYALLLDIASQGQKAVTAQSIPDKNPAYNQSINPNYNTKINPNYNTTLNPNYNTTLNPNYNTSINPNYNRTLNPNYNAAYDGPFDYELNATRKGFGVRINDKIVARFDNNAKFIGTAIARGDGGFNVYDAKGKWISYLVPDGRSGFLEFDTSGKWTGFSL